MKQENVYLAVVETEVYSLVGYGALECDHSQENYIDLFAPSSNLWAPLGRRIVHNQVDLHFTAGLWKTIHVVIECRTNRRNCSFLRPHRFS